MIFINKFLIFKSAVSPPLLFTSLRASEGQSSWQENNSINILLFKHLSIIYLASYAEFVLQMVSYMIRDETEHHKYHDFYVRMP